MENYAVQYTIVGILILIAIVAIGIKVYKTGVKKNTQCMGCSLSEVCSDKKKPLPGIKSGKTSDSNSYSSEKETSRQPSDKNDHTKSGCRK